MTLPLSWSWPPPRLLPTRTCRGLLTSSSPPSPWRSRVACQRQSPQITPAPPSNSTGWFPKNNKKESTASTSASFKLLINKRCFRNIYAPHGAKFRLICPKASKQGIKIYKVDKTLGSKEWFDLDLWTGDLKINRDHLLIKGNPCTKFGIDQVKGSKDIEWTTLGLQTDRPIERPTDSWKTICPLYQGGHKNTEEKTAFYSSK